MKKPVPYTHYKPSGVEWLGNVPSHWDVSRLKWCFDISCGSTPESGESSYWDGDVTWVTPADLSRLDSKFIYGSMRTITQEGFDSCALTLVKPGSVILATRAPIGTLGVAATLLCHNQGCKALSSTDRASSLFVYYYLLSVNKELNMKGKGTTFLELGTPDLGCFEMPVPPLSEQKAIAAFLDRETARIDGLIAKREKLIVLLQEKRAALISHAVTKGLNPSAKMKPSGIDWLGNMPAHWETDKIKYNTFSCSGGTPNTENQDYWNGDIPWVSPKDMKASRISATEDSITELGLKESASRLIDENTVLIVVRSGILKHTIPVAINVVPVSINQDMKALFTKEKVTSDYLFYFINGVQENLLPLWRKQGCTVESIEQEFMGNTCLPIPPVSEQKAIAEYLDTETKKIDGLLEKEQQIIERMKEYRSSLITAAVTGKIDVREDV